MLKYNRHLKPIARKLRNAQTVAEQLLWSRLRGNQVHGVPFYRQKPIGPYIVDFYGPAANLVIEVDGSQHADPIQHDQDIFRDSYLNELGLHVVQFDNLQVRFEIDAVMEAISEAVRRYGKSPQPPFSKGVIKRTDRDVLT